MSGRTRLNSDDETIFEDESEDKKSSSLHDLNDF